MSSPSAAYLMSGHGCVLDRDLCLPDQTLDQNNMRLKKQLESSSPVFSAKASLPEVREQVLEDGLSGGKLPPSPSPMQSPSADPTPSEVDRDVEIKPASRPGFGNVGEKVLVRANNFPIEFELEDVVYQYEFKVDPVVKEEVADPEFMLDLLEQYGKSHLGQLKIAYNGHNVIYSAGLLPYHPQDFELLLLGKDGGQRKYKVSSKFVKAINLLSLKQFMDRTPTECPYDTFQALVLRESPLENYVGIPRFVFSPEFGCKAVDEGLQPKQMALRSNVASSNMSLGLIEFVSAYLNVDLRPNSSALQENQRLEIQKALQGVWVETTHVPRRYKVTGISTESACEFMFYARKRETSVAKYFEEKYGRKLVYQSLPCINAGSDDRPIYLPMELCKIVDGQRCTTRLRNSQITQTLEAMCQQLSQKKENNDNAEAKRFVIVVNRNLTPVKARLLPPPELKYNDSGPEKTFHPNSGQWNMKNKRVFEGSNADAWAFICFAPVELQHVENFCNRLMEVSQRIGMVFNPEPVHGVMQTSSDNVEESLRSFNDRCIEILNSRNSMHKQLQLLLVILPKSKNTHLYVKIKRFCDTELGLITQCCNFNTFSKYRLRCLENLALKINVKLGGRNTVLEDASTKLLQLVADTPTIIFGADVTHPAPGDNSSPSIASVVASMDPFFTKYRGLVSTQKCRQEIIKGLYTVAQDPESGQLVHGGMIRELIEAFSSENGYYPERIIFYRDGVSDGKLNQVLSLEVTAIIKACNSIDKNYHPTITFVVVQKRHRTRLFSGNVPTESKSKSVQPGTVVDKNICNPVSFSFYLCSHAGVQGTSKPTHYIILYDENKFSADGIQTLTNNLCYTYARSTCSLSVVPPAHYAHLAACRARYHMDGGNVLPRIKDNIKGVMFYC